MRASQTEPGQNERKSRPDGRNSELRRAETAEGDAEPRDTGNGGADARAPANRAGSYLRDGVAPSSWQDIKSRFVDDPAGAVAAAEELVRRTVEDKVRALEEEAAAICVRERDEDESSTETLRTRLIRYEAYCERLASTSARESV